MSARALYRKHRSKSLSEVVGQTHITDILQRALQQGKIAHAYLFTGPRGVGKTSVARILAHEINKLPYDESTIHPDIIEIDAASNRRIDDIRELRDKVQIAPSSAKYKVYIIDEVHMLTGESFNAFLKTLEEPPAHVIFILATTDAHKLPVTITSRTQRFTFRAITPSDALTHLKAIAKTEKIAIDDDALELIVQHGDGSFRDSISLLDQLSSLADETQSITRQLVERVLGLAPQARIDTLLQAYLSADRTAIISLLTQLEQDGIGATVAAGQLLRAARANLAESPELITLFSALVLVLTSPRPDVQLLVALLPPVAAPVAPKNTTAATVVSGAPELKTLEKEALRPTPSESHVRQEVKKQAPAKEPAVAEKIAPKPVSDLKAVKKEEVVDAPDAVPIEPAPKKSHPAAGTVEFDWNTYLAHIKVSSIAIGSILAKCKGESDGTTLTIFTGTAFWKKKLDDIKYQPALHDALTELGVGELTIETIPATMPPKDSQAAAVAAIMGGGEEIEL